MGFFAVQIPASVINTDDLLWVCCTHTQTQTFVLDDPQGGKVRPRSGASGGLRGPQGGSQGTTLESFLRLLIRQKKRTSNAKQ